MQKLCALDTEHLIEKLAWSEFPGSIRALLNNPNVFESFWDFQNGKITEAAWEERLRSGKRNRRRRGATVPDQLFCISPPYIHAQPAGTTTEYPSASRR